MDRSLAEYEQESCRGINGIYLFSFLTMQHTMDFGHSESQLAVACMRCVLINDHRRLSRASPQCMQIYFTDDTNDGVRFVRNQFDDYLCDPAPNK